MRLENWCRLDGFARLFIRAAASTGGFGHYQLWLSSHFWTCLGDRNIFPIPGKKPDPPRNGIQQSERELAHAARHGDEAAFAEIVQRHSRYLFGIARTLTAHSEDAEDLFQEVFLNILKSPFRGESSLRTWLVKILVRQAALIRRKRGRERTIPLFGQGAEEKDDAASRLDASDARIDLQTMLQQLSAEHREVIVLRELEQLSYEEMATALRIPRGTVESRLHRAREELRIRFGRSQ